MVFSRELRRRARTWLCCLYFGKNGLRQMSHPSKGGTLGPESRLHDPLQACSCCVNQSETLARWVFVPRLGAHHGSLPSARSRARGENDKLPCFLFHNNPYLYLSLFYKHDHDHDHGRETLTITPTVSRRRQSNAIFRPRAPTSVIGPQFCRCQRSELPVYHACVRIRPNDKLSLYSSCMTGKSCDVTG